MHPLKAYRRAHKLKQHQLAEFLGCSQPYISRVEGGLVPPVGRALDWQTRTKGRIRAAQINPRIRDIVESAVG